MRNRILLLSIACFSIGLTQAQTTEELTALKETKAAELTTLEAQLKDLTATVDALKTEVADLTDKITPYPRWDIGARGNLGFNISNFSDWLSKEASNTNAISIGFTGNGYANLDQKKYFWRNNLNLALGWQKFDDEDDPNDDNKEFKVTSDAFNVTTLFGYKLSDKWALSTLAEYRSSLIDNFNNPGYLDVGAGATWTPITDLVVVIHPLNYNFVFADSGFDYQSSFGTKIVADYKREIVKGINWTSNLSAFMSYKGIDLSNWTWINGLTTTVKGFGVGLDIGLRSNRQEAEAAGLSNNPLQTYWVLGLTYALGK
ncbi:MAG TPA: DUF3078 domain-containing protein [Saprospiraceae bacterium]|nr:DUF3078 domain-containing protein [Saprospiraceae bacterium]